MYQLDKEQAIEVAQAHLKIGWKESWGKLIILEDSIIEKEYGWIFFYTTKQFLETGEEGLCGNSPFLVKKEVTVHGV
jgi:hypothetical protein